MRGSVDLLRKAAACAALGLVAPLAQALDGAVVATGLNQPLYLTAPGGDGRQFIVEKGGLVKVLSGGVVQASPFLDLSAQVGTSGEQGLLGLAFDPAFSTNGRLYVNYVDKATSSTVVERYTLAAGAQSVDTASAQRIITIDQPPYENHKAGWIAFRPGDANNLYIATGDGGNGNDPQNNAQNPSSLLGKILRLDVSGNGMGYAVPTSNPFVGQDDVRPELWALGLRNPWRNSFDRATGDLWIADVGQGAREEINLERAGDPGGHNYGWRLREGSIPTPGVGGSAPGLTDPIYEYTRDVGQSITGGYVYRGPSIEGADGRYFFGDFVASKLFSFALDAQGQVIDLRDDTAAVLGGTGLQGISSLGEDGLGRLYVVGINGVVVSLVPEPSNWALVLAGGLAVAWSARRRRPRV
ncbi:MAG: PQQ-dependent sugar dehydrogenase [Aquabacterium sp.]|jgi:glucose/arabinose dehydrogenase|uniref:PQQ-dependent sugar dehydrogenase n=1 Tax=Aquabacterium sp. TaxID=1872578 RepID=UPI003BB17517